MKYTQKAGWIGSLNVEIDFLDTGFNYTLYEKGFTEKDRKSIFINYGMVTNDKAIVVYKRSMVSVIYSIVAIIIYAGYITISTNSAMILGKDNLVINFIMTYGGVITVTYLIGALLLYRKVLLKKLVQISMSNGAAISLIVDKQKDAIFSELIKRRDQYLRKHYLDKKGAKDYISLEIVEYLYSLKTIDSREFDELIKAIDSRIKEEERDTNVGFNKEEESLGI